MITAFEVKSEDHLMQFGEMPGARKSTLQDTLQKPDACWITVDDLGEVSARCSLWWTRAPLLTGHRVGLIGHFTATKSEAARMLLQQACRQLALQGCTIAVGPVDGSTWQRYRLITERNQEPPFFLEPDNPEEWPTYFTESGFMTLATYSSALNADLSRRDPRVDKARKRLESTGISIRPLRMDDFAGELSRIHSVAEVSFRKNFLYTSISKAAFVAQYQSIRDFIRPDFCLIAEHNQQAVGFIFALPDALQSARTEAIDTVIIKTVAVLPERDYAGLGVLLVDRCQQAACNLGYRRAIHALMHDANNSLNISSRYGRVIRRYSLFARELADQPLRLCNSA